MASLSTDRRKNRDGRVKTTRRVQFFAMDGSRKTVHLGNMSLAAAKDIRDKIHALNVAQIAQVAIDGRLAEWLATIGDTLYDKLVVVGLCQPREPIAGAKSAKATLGEFLAEYLDMRSDVKPSTMRHLREAKKKLEEFFGADRAMDSITALDAEAYRLHLAKGLGDNTVRRMVSRARQFFRAALRGRRVAENPFGEMKGLGVRAVEERKAFITREQTDKLLEAAPDAEWRAIIALARFGGLRVPSELEGLRWINIDWTAGTFMVTSPKTAHCGKARRVVPLFPELRRWLREAEAQAAITEADGTMPEFVISRCRSAKVNLRTGLERIITKAGLEQWPKLFVNLRASRATELADEYPGHVAAAWLGHSEAVANEHYRQVTDDHVRRAAGMTANIVGDVAQNAAQQITKTDGNGMSATQRPIAAHKKAPGFPVLSTAFAVLPDYKVPPPGTRTRNPLIKSQML